MSRNIYSITLSTATLLLTMLFMGHASAATPAVPIKEQPISIYADQLSIDDATGVSLYRGNVEFQQGELKFSGEELEIIQTEGSVTLMKARGKPAHFERSAPKALKAEAIHIDYDNQKGEVILRGDAILRQDGNLFSGALIHYYIDSRRVLAQGVSESGNGNGRVHVLLRPKEDKPEESSPQENGK